MNKQEGVPFPKREKFEGGFVGMLKRRLPVLQWAPRYSRTRALADVIAGATLGLTLVPQSIAYASLANLPMQYGLYSSFIGTMLYVVLGTVKEVSIGPTSLMALLTLHTCRDLPIDYMFLLTFLSGCVVLLMGLLQLGFLVDLISPSVTSGFTSGTAVIIVVAQIKGLLGVSFVAESIWDNVHFIAMKWHEVRLGDCLLSAVCCTVLLSLRKLKDVKVSPKRPRLKWSLWLISISRNAVVVCAAAVFAFCTHDPHQPMLKLSGRVEPGLPPLSLPPFSVVEGDVTVGFPEMVRRLGAGVVLLPLVMVLSNISIAKAFSSGKRVDATQEMLTLGLVNVAGAFVHAMPTCGAFTRSAVSHSSGVRTPAAGLYSGIITLLALSFMTPYFYFIPKACLSSVLICAVIFMVDISTVRTLWYRNKYELFVVGATFGVSVLWSVELAVLAGVLTSLALLMRQLMRPAVHVHTHKTGGVDVIVVKPAMALLYLNAERFAARVCRALSTAANPPPVLIDCGDLSAVDYHAGQVLEKLAQKFKYSNQQLILYNAFNEALRTLHTLDHVERRALTATSVTEALDSTIVKMMDREEAAPLLTDGQQKQDV